MSTRRALDGDIFENNLRESVSACRKRLRRNRLAQTAVVTNPAEDVFPETKTAASELHDDSGNVGIREYTVCIDNDYFSSEFQGTEPTDSELLLLAGEQEVGIT